MAARLAAPPPRVSRGQQARASAAADDPDHHQAPIDGNAAGTVYSARVVVLFFFVACNIVDQGLRVVYQTCGHETAAPACEKTITSFFDLIMTGWEETD